MTILKIALHSLFLFVKAAKQINIHAFVNRSRPSATLNLLSLCLPPPEPRREKDYSVMCDFNGSLLKSTSPFPFLMALAFEAGGLLRAILLLLCFPLIMLLGEGSDLGLKTMVFVTFCGLKTRDMEIVATAVLNKVYLEDLHRRGYEMVAAAGRKLVASHLPRVMVEGFLKEYVGVEVVVAPELEVMAKGMYFTGFFACSGRRHYMEGALRELLGEDKVDVGLVSSGTSEDQFLISYSKEVYVLNKEETVINISDVAGGITSASSSIPKQKYPKPLVFHDGRLAFLPTPAATLAVLLFLPLSLILSILRILIGILFPYHLSIAIASALGVRIRVSRLSNPNSKPRTATGGVLYVCNHRTLIDPIILSISLARSVPAVTYSLSPITEAVSPIPTIRLTRDRRLDAATIRGLLDAGDLAICPEGTTCREPYLLRFSPLFAELASNIEPVALDVEASMFYGTTASGIKWLDPIFFFMNPRPSYYAGFLGQISPEMTASNEFPAADVANMIQRKLADALGFECTALTRRDKYLVLAGNDGIVAPQSTEKR